jgi:hypothetical protein
MGAFLIVSLLAGTLAPAGPEYSNILPADYVGPEICKQCHQDEYKAWSHHPHSRMNKDAGEQTVVGDFSGKRVAYEDGFIVFAREKGAYTMTLERGGKMVRRFRVTRTVGSRFMQFYVGVQTLGPEATDNRLYFQEQKLPFGYWFKLKRWLPTSYFDPVGPETNKDGTPAYDPFDHPRGRPWSQNCMLCHNTYAFAYRLALPNGLAGFPPEDIALKQRELGAELAKTLAPPSDAARTVRERIDPDKNLVTLGISCESCHFGGREHALEKRVIRFLPTSPWLRVQPKDPAKAISDKENPYFVMNACAQCHRARVSLFPNGSGTWNSREALDMMTGACASKIKCTDCHNPHQAGPPEAARDDASHVNACLECHAPLQKAAARAAHIQHSAAVSCLDCHMPRATQGLEEVVRTHRISSPTELRMLAAGSANACNLCHLDRSIAWTLRELEQRWKKKIEPGPDWARAYGGSLDNPVGLAWLHGPDSSMRLVAAQAYSRTRLGRTFLADVIRGLGDPIPVNRVFGTFAVERIRGRTVSVSEFDATAPPAVRSKQIAAMLDRIRSAAAAR